VGILEGKYIKRIEFFFWGEGWDMWLVCSC
jgi:hypothetical protein